MAGEDLTNGFRRIVLGLNREHVLIRRDCLMSDSFRQSCKLGSRPAFGGWPRESEVIRDRPTHCELIHSEIHGSYLTLRVATLSKLNALNITRTLRMPLLPSEVSALPLSLSLSLSLCIDPAATPAEMVAGSRCS